MSHLTRLIIILVITIIANIGPMPPAYERPSADPILEDLFGGDHALVHDIVGIIARDIIAADHRMQLGVDAGCRGIYHRHGDGDCRHSGAAGLFDAGARPRGGQIAGGDTDDVDVHGAAAKLDVDCTALAAAIRDACPSSYHKPLVNRWLLAAARWINPF